SRAAPGTEDKPGTGPYGRRSATSRRLPNSEFAGRYRPGIPKTRRNKAGAAAVEVRQPGTGTDNKRRSRDRHHLQLETYQATKRRYPHRRNLGSRRLRRRLPGDSGKLPSYRPGSRISLPLRSLRQTSRVDEYDFRN